MPTSKLDTITRQAELTAAALALAAERSPADVTTADLARAVGITQGAVYRHFPSKEAIWVAVIEQVQVALMDRLQMAADRLATEPLQALRAIFLAHVEFVIEHPAVPRVIFQELQSAQDTVLKSRVRELMDAYRQLLLQVLKQARNDGLLSDDVELPAAIALFIGAVQGLVMQTMLSGDLRQMRLQAPKVYALWQQALASELSEARRANDSPATAHDSNPQPGRKKHMKSRGMSS